MKRVLMTVGVCFVLQSSPLMGQQTPATETAKPQVHTQESQAAMTPSAALDQLKEGNARFASNLTKKRDWSAKVLATASGQFPFAAILACMDSRAPVEIVFDQGLGDTFGIRIAGNVINDDELGSLESAVTVGTKLIVVLGHTQCGAIKGAIDDVELGNLTALLAKIRPSVAAAKCSGSADDACVTKVTELNVHQSMKEIRERSAYLKKYLDDGKVGLVGGIYNLATGKVTFLEN
jgi:carbonic anhydrase